jgi:hypothetical protein
VDCGIPDLRKKRGGIFEPFIDLDLGREDLRRDPFRHLQGGSVGDVKGELRAWSARPRHSRPVTMGHIRGHGCRDLLVYCSSARCHHSATMNGDYFPDELAVRSLCGRMVCTRCG